MNFEKKRRQAFENALIIQQPTLSPAVQLIQGNTGILLVIPLYQKGMHKGFLLGVINPKEWMNHIIQSNHALSKDLNFLIHCIYDGSSLYKQTGFDSRSIASLEMSGHSELLNQSLDIFVRPLPEYLHLHSRTFSNILLIISILVSLLLSVIIHLLQKASMESWLVKTSQTALEHEVTTRIHAERELQKTLMRLDMATKAGGIGIWSWDIASGKLNWNEQMFHLYDYPQDISPTYETWRNSLHLADAGATETLLKKAVEGKAIFQTEFRINLTNGDIRYLGAAARVERDQNGSPSKVTGINWDITELKTAQQSLQRLSEMQNILMDISMSYINIPLENISEAVQEALEKMGLFCWRRSRIYFRLRFY